jgi:hypothetical protein
MSEQLPADQLPTEVSYEHAADHITHALKEAAAEGIPLDQVLLALADMVSSFAWKLGGEAKVLSIMKRIDATIDVLNGKRLPLQSRSKN